MKCVGVWVMVAAASCWWVGAACAENEAEHRSPAAAPARLFAQGEVLAQPKLAPARPGMFAAASAANAKRMTEDQREERRFLKDAAATSRFASEASRLALAKSNDARVRSFAATLINHNAGATAMLQHMLHGRGMAPPMLSTDQRKSLNRLAKLNGLKFDREFMDGVGPRYQQEEIDYYQKAGQAARDPALRAWIDQTLPTLHYHLSMAERIAPPDSRLAKAAPTRTHKAGQFVGAGALQLGVARPVAARPTESNSR